MDTLDELYCMAEAYAHGRAHANDNPVIPTVFAQAYVDNWKVWQDTVTDTCLPFMAPDEYYKTYSAIN